MSETETKADCYEALIEELEDYRLLFQRMSFMQGYIIGHYVFTDPLISTVPEEVDEEIKENEVRTWLKNAEDDEAFRNGLSLAKYHYGNIRPWLRQRLSVNPEFQYSGG